jgi:hypothetical protein
MHLPGSHGKTARKRETRMAKIDLDSLSIEELASLRDHATEKLFEKVAARQAELEAELEKLSQYGKPTKKSLLSAPVAKARKGDEKKSDEVKEPIAKAA